MIDDLSTYELQHFLPFTREVYERLFTLHNEAWWPLQLLVGAATVAMLWRLWRRDGRTVAVLLGIAWAFVGWAFFVDRYAELLWAAPWIGGAFGVQALLLFVAAARDRFELDDGWRGRLALGGAALVIVGWPLLAPLSGREWTGVELFGIAPDPTAIATLVVLAGAERAQWLSWPIPILWCVLTALTTWTMELHIGLAAPIVAVIVVGARIAAWARGRD